MKIGDSKPPSRATRPRDAVASYTRTQRATPATAVDSATVMGISEAELTPKVRDAIMTLMQEVDTLRRELSQTQAQLAQLERLADQDALTPVHNRRAFVRELSRVISLADRYNVPSSLIYFDINGFKTINDTHGHAAGDAALLHVASVLVEQIRESDTVGRLGGDEFGVLLAYADEQQVKDKADQLAHAISATPIEWNNEKLRVDVAYGTATFRGGESVTDAMATADAAMYRHKKQLSSET